MRLGYTIAHSIGGVWGADPGGDRDLPVVRVADFDYAALKVNRFVPTSRSISESERAARLLEPGDILLEKSGGGLTTNVGRAVLWTSSEPTVCSNFIQLLRPASGYDSRFLVYLHRALYVRGVAAACTKQNTGIQNLSVRDYLATAVDVPTIERQRATADSLDRECDRIAVLEALVLRLNAAGAASLRDWFRAKIADRPLLPLRRCITTIADGPFGSSLASAHYVDEPGVRVIRLGDVGLAEFRESSAAFVAEEYAKGGLSEHRAVAGDLVMAGLGDANNPLGRAALVPAALDGAVHKADCYRIRVDELRWDPHYVSWALSYGPARDEAPLMSRGSTRARLNTVVARDLPIPSLSLDEQHELVRAAQRRRDGFRSVSGSAAALTTLLAEYRDALITEAVTGQLDVTAVSDAQMDERLHEAVESATA